ncbi:MAG: hypothetical protein IPM64_16800 [Phycisphaerales bacterium]|nr:hypothetical protein [Phycisphaerales bacterium]
MAQEPPNAYESATQPGPGTFIFKPQLRYFYLDDAPSSPRSETHQLNFSNTLNFGIAPDWSASIRFPLEQRWQSDRASSDEESFGIGDLTTLLKWRVWRNDTSPLDTQRLAVFGGLEWPLGQSEFSSYSFDPIVGTAYTQVSGRHGINLSGAWKFTTDGDENPLLAGDGQADLLRYDAAYLFRLDPERYTAETKGAWYAVLELNGLYETNGDHEVFLSPGIMFEAQSWVLEFSVQLPAVQRLDHRPETDFAVIFGLRFLF